MMLRRLFQKIIFSFKKAVGIGTPDIKPGETIDTNGVGDQHSDKYYVDEVSHTFDTKGYRQRFHLNRNATGDSDKKDTD